MSDVFAVLIHWHDANSVVRRHYANHSCRCNSVAVFCFGVFADECLWRSGVRSTYPNSARKFAKGWIRVRLKGEALARCTDGTRGKEYVHFTEDGFRDNRAGACCVAKSTGRTVVWNDIHSLSDSTRKVHIYMCYTWKNIYVSQDAPRFCSGTQTANLERRGEGEWGGEKDRFEKEGPLSDSTAQSRHSTQIIYRLAWASLCSFVLFLRSGEGMNFRAGREISLPSFLNGIGPQKDGFFFYSTLIFLGVQKIRQIDFFTIVERRWIGRVARVSSFLRPVPRSVKKPKKKDRRFDIPTTKSMVSASSSKSSAP